MNASTQRTRCSRLLVLGAVVAGLAASPAAAAASQPTQLGLIADGLRLQAIADVYQARAVPAGTTAGAPAPMPAGLTQGQAADRLVGNAWTRTSPAEFRKLVTAFGSDVTTTMTPQQARAALARGEGLNQLARRYSDATTASPASSGSGFDWADAGIGVATALGAVLLAVAVLITLRRQRRLILPRSPRIG